MPIYLKKKSNYAYDVSSYGTEHPNYVKIMVDESNLSSYQDLFNHSEKLDPLNKNDSVGSESCETVNLCVPSVYVPTVTKQLVSESVDSTGKPTDLDYKVAEDVRNLADRILEIPEADLKTSKSFLVGNILFAPKVDTNELGYTEPTFDPNSWKDKDYQDLLRKLKDLMDDNVDPEKLKVSVTNSDLTERVIDGHGTFDWIASAIFNQLNYVKNQGLIGNDDIATVYTQSLAQGLQTAVQFTLEKDRIHLANLAQLAQIKTANVQALLAKAELLMLPNKMELAYAQLEIQRRQIDLLNYQIELQKRQIPQAEIATQLSLVQLEGAKEEVKIKNTQWQQGLKQIKLADAQLKQIAADLKLKAQALLKDREQIALIKAQTATTYAQVTAAAEAIKAAKAQYSDTIDGEVIGGVLGAQIAVNKMQAEAFDRDSFYKFATTVSDGWKAKKTADIATLSPNAYTAFGVDRVFARYAQYFNMSVNTFDLPTNYTDYLTDAEMDGTAPTPSSSNSTVRP